jgi:uncharacterized protein
VIRLVAVMLLAQVAVAQAQSFDCTRASTVVEKAICDDGNPGLALRDAALGRLYAALKTEGGHDAVLAGQAAWLKSRDRCGAKAACLERAYDKRLGELARAAGDAGGVTGTYRYHLPGEEGADYSNDGEAFVVREADGTLSGSISTVSGPTYHTCEVQFEAAEEAEGAAWQWQGSEDEVDFEGKTCVIDFAARPGELRISSQNCSYFCGARGWFDETYARVK